MDVQSSELWVMQKDIGGVLKGTSASLKMAAFIPSQPPGRRTDHVNLLKSLSSQPFGTAPNGTYCSGKSTRALGTEKLKKMQGHLPGSLPSPPSSPFLSSSSSSAFNYEMSIARLSISCL